MDEEKSEDPALEDAIKAFRKKMDRTGGKHPVYDGEEKKIKDRWAEALKKNHKLRN